MDIAALTGILYPILEKIRDSQIDKKQRKEQAYQAVVLPLKYLVNEIEVTMQADTPKKARRVLVVIEGFYTVMSEAIIHIDEFICPELLFRLRELLVKVQRFNDEFHGLGSGTKITEGTMSIKKDAEEILKDLKKLK